MVGCCNIQFFESNDKCLDIRDIIDAKIWFCSIFLAGKKKKTKAKEDPSYVTSHFEWNKKFDT